MALCCKAKGLFAVKGGERRGAFPELAALACAPVAFSSDTKRAIPSPALLPLCGNRVPPQRTVLGETPLAQARAAAAFPAGRRGVSQSKCPGAGRTATTATAASGGYRELLLGPRPARRKRQRADAGCRNPISLARERSPLPCAKLPPLVNSNLPRRCAALFGHLANSTCWRKMIQ